MVMTLHVKLAVYLLKCLLVLCMDGIHEGVTSTHRALSTVLQLEVLEGLGKRYHCIHDNHSIATLAVGPLQVPTAQGWARTEVRGHKLAAQQALQVGTVEKWVWMAGVCQVDREQIEPILGELRQLLGREKIQHDRYRLNSYSSRGLFQGTFQNNTNSWFIRIGWE